MNFTPASGSETDDAMEPGAEARGAMKPTAIAAWFYSVFIYKTFSGKAGRREN